MKIITKTLSANLLRTLGVVGLFAVAQISAATACSRVLSNENDLVIVGRTMDWPSTTEPIIHVFPKGMSRDGGRAGAQVVDKENPARWTSKYGSIVTSVFGLGTADGFNERGLGVHMLYLRLTDYGPVDTSKKGVQAGLWAQYLLDNAATVEEALHALESIRIVNFETHGFAATVHLAVEDASGDSAIIEFVKGKKVVHHGRQYRIMTNDPSYDEQLALLKQQDFSHPSSDTPLPGNVKATDRFQRAAYYSSMLPKPKNEREAVSGILAIVRNLSVPFGAPYAKFGIYNTEYRTVSNLSEKRYFFELTTSPNVIWMDLTSFDLSPGAAPLTLNPDDVSLSGDVSGKFTKAIKAPY